MTTVKRVTSIDVARAANVSKATASYVLSGRRLNKVSQQTQERVLQAAKDLGYKINRLAIGLKTQHSHAIGIICTNDRMPYFNTAVQECHTYLSAYDYHLVLCYADFQTKSEQLAIKFLEELCVEGAIFFSASAVPKSNDHLVDFAQTTPLVIVNRYIPSIFPVAAVRIKHEEAGRMAARHLIALGRKHLAILGTPTKSLGGVGHYNGFKDTVGEAGLICKEISTRINQANAFDVSGGYQSIQTLLQHKNDVDIPDGIYAINDYVAAGAIRAFTEAGFVIPDDVAVIGNDNTVLAPRFMPSLTSISQRLNETGLKASELLLTRLEKHVSQPDDQIIIPELIIRESTVRNAFSIQAT